MNVLMFSPGFPREMRYFTRGLAEVGANVIGLGDQPEAALEEPARSAVSMHIQVRSWLDEDAILGQVADVAKRVPIHRVECLWEPYMVLAARIREMLGLPGMTVEQTIPLRDKEIMKRVLDGAGIRTPHHYSATTAAQVVEAAETIGYPVIVKPIDGTIDLAMEKSVTPALNGKLSGGEIPLAIGILGGCMVVPPTLFTVAAALKDQIPA